MVNFWVLMRGYVHCREKVGRLAAKTIKECFGNTPLACRKVSHQKHGTMPQGMIALTQNTSRLHLVSFGCSSC